MTKFAHMDTTDAIKWSVGNLEEVKEFLGPWVWVGICKENRAVLFLANTALNEFSDRRDDGLPETRAAVVWAPTYIGRSPRIGGADPAEVGYKFHLFGDQGSNADWFETYYQPIGEAP